jgi:hypothetical protein
MTEFRVYQRRRLEEANSDSLEYACKPLDSDEIFYDGTVEGLARKVIKAGLYVQGQENIFFGSTSFGHNVIFDNPGRAEQEITLNPEDLRLFHFFLRKYSQDGKHS